MHCVVAEEREREMFTYKIQVCAESKVILHGKVEALLLSVSLEHSGVFLSSGWDERVAHVGNFLAFPKQLNLDYLHFFFQVLQLLAKLFACT